MKIAEQFIPTAGVVGMLPMVTYFFLVVAMYAFLGNFIFALATRNSVGPEHRSSQTMTAIIAAVAGISYYFIQSYYRDVLADVAAVTDPADRQTILRQSYNAIGQYRYIDWAVTTPLLLVKMTQMLRIRPQTIARSLALLLGADFFMVLTGYVGEQQLAFNNEILVAPKLIWGAVATVGYGIVPYVLYRYWRQFAAGVLPEERRAYRLMALTTVTFWGVYPIGYILTVFDIDFNWIHIAFSVADVINKVGLAVVAYIAAKEALERQVSEDAVAPTYQLD